MLLLWESFIYLACPIVHHKSCGFCMDCGIDAQFHPCFMAAEQISLNFCYILWILFFFYYLLKDTTSITLPEDEGQYFSYQMHVDNCNSFQSVFLALYNWTTLKCFQNQILSKGLLVVIAHSVLKRSRCKNFMFGYYKE